MVDGKSGAGKADWEVYVYAWLSNCVSGNSVSVLEMPHGPIRVSGWESGPPTLT